MGIVLLPIWKVSLQQHQSVIYILEVLPLSLIGCPCSLYDSVRLWDGGDEGTDRPLVTAAAPPIVTFIIYRESRLGEDKILI